MSAKSLSGKDLAEQIRADTAVRAAGLSAAGVVPTLAVVTATADESSAWYVRSIVTAAGKCGIAARVVDLGVDADAGRIISELRALGADRSVHGVILQTPLPAGVAAALVVGEVPVHKDVDGANPESLGRLAARLAAFVPATAAAVMRLLEFHGVPLSGRPVTVVGRSVVVGKPVAHLLLNADATVTVAHSRTRDLAAATKGAEVLVVAAGRSGLVTGEHVAPGAVVVDVGTNPTDDGGLAGDVDAASVSQVAGALSPVPGGVGPVTTALLLEHTVRAAEHAAHWVVSA